MVIGFEAELFIFNGVQANFGSELTIFKTFQHQKTMPLQKYTFEALKNLNL